MGFYKDIMVLRRGGRTVSIISSCHLVMVMVMIISMSSTLVISQPAQRAPPLVVPPLVPLAVVAPPLVPLVVVVPPLAPLTLGIPDAPAPAPAGR